MTVAELMKELKKHDANLEVRVEYDGDYRKLLGVGVGKLYIANGKLSRSGDNLAGTRALLLT